MKNLNEKLLDLKKHIGKVSKESTNPFFKSKYMDLPTLLEHVEPMLQERNLLLLQPLEGDKVRTTIVNTDMDDDLINSYLTLPNLTDPQKIGSCITYFRRYTLKSLLGIQEEDDDGNKASKPEPVVKKKLSSANYEKALNGTSIQISNVLKKFDLSDAQTKALKEAEKQAIFNEEIDENCDATEVDIY